MAHDCHFEKLHKGYVLLWKASVCSEVCWNAGVCCTSHRCPPPKFSWKRSDFGFEEVHTVLLEYLYSVQEKPKWCAHRGQTVSLILFIGKLPHHPLPTPEAQGSGEAPDARLGPLQPRLTTQVTLLYVRNLFLITFYWLLKYFIS